MMSGLSQMEMRQVDAAGYGTSTNKGTDTSKQLRDQATGKLRV